MPNSAKNDKGEFCPECRYNLFGIPDVHRCPECGYLYIRGVSPQSRPLVAEEWWIVPVGAAIVSVLFLWLAAFPLYAAFVDPQVLYYQRSAEPTAAMFDAVWLSILGVGLLIAYTRFAIPKFYSRISWTAKGIRWRELWYHAEQFVPWEFVRDVELGLDPTRIDLILTLEGSLSIPPRFYRKKGVATEMYDSIRSEWAKARDRTK